MMGTALSGYLFAISGRLPSACAWKNISKTCLSDSHFFYIQVSPAFLSLYSILYFFMYFTACSLALFIVLLALGASLDLGKYFFF